MLNTHASAAIKKSPQFIKVKIASNLKQLKLSGHNITKKDLTNQTTRKYRGNKSIYFNCKPRRTKLQHRPSVLIASLKVGKGLISWDKSSYKGDLLVVTNNQHSGCDLINNVSLEDYISSLLAKEMNSRWHIEALKAQAVAARSYAHQKIESQSLSETRRFKAPYDIVNSERYQVSGGFQDATARTIQAASETAGEILITTKGDNLVPIFYHADCGGRTVLPKEVWGVDYPDYRSVKCVTPGRKKDNSWKVEISMMQWMRFITWYKNKNKLSPNKSRIKIYTDRKSRSYLKVVIDKKVRKIPKSQIRRFFGHKKISSSYFVFKRTGRFYSLFGAGRGHGVGMSQIGALYLAKDGMNYRQILKHFYPGFKIQKIY